MEERASGDNVVPIPVYEGEKTREYGTTVLLPSIDHTSERSQNRSERTDQGCRASHFYKITNV